MLDIFNTAWYNADHTYGSRSQIWNEAVRNMVIEIKNFRMIL